MYKKIFLVFFMILTVGCRATYNERLAIAKNSKFSGPPAKQINFNAILKTLTPAKNKKPELYHISLQKYAANAYCCWLFWIIGDIEEKKFKFIDADGKGNVFTFSKEKFSPNEPNFITGFSGFFIETSYAKSIKKVLLLDKNDNVLTELDFDKAEITENPVIEPDEVYYFGESIEEKVKFSLFKLNFSWNFKVLRKQL